MRQPVRLAQPEAPSLIYSAAFPSVLEQARQGSAPDCRPGGVCSRGTGPHSLTSWAAGVGRLPVCHVPGTGGRSVKNMSPLLSSRAHSLVSWFSKWTPGPAASPSPENLLEAQIHKPRLSPTKSATLRPGHLHFHTPPGCLGSTRPWACSGLGHQAPNYTAQLVWVYSQDRRESQDAGNVRVQGQVTLRSESRQTKTQIGLSWYQTAAKIYGQQRKKAKCRRAPTYALFLFVCTCELLLQSVSRWIHEKLVTDGCI